jgi:hypothetical protein
MAPNLDITLKPGHPDFLDLPWRLPLSEWPGNCARLEEVPRGLSRHPVLFVNYGGELYALKELPRGVAEQEYRLLNDIHDRRLPVVQAAGFVRLEDAGDERSVLITRYLDHSIPYRSLFMSSALVRYQEHLLDAIAGLLVQLHLSGVYWGDCSLSNTLFRLDARTLQAYLVDAETAEIYEPIPPAMRYYDLEIMEENVSGDLADLEATASLALNIPFSDISVYIRLRYGRLWEEITQETIINPGEHYRIQERIRALNALGYSVGEVELFETASGNQLRLRVVVSDRNFHRDQLMILTGLVAEENQARAMMNEIQELKATLSHQNNRSTPLSVAAYHWLENIYLPTIERLKPVISPDINEDEMYIQVLEHKWYLSEQAQRDVGHQTAVEDFIKNQHRG